MILGVCTEHNLKLAVKREEDCELAIKLLEVPAFLWPLWLDVPNIGNYDNWLRLVSIIPVIRLTEKALRLGGQCHVHGPRELPSGPSLLLGTCSICPDSSNLPQFSVWNLQFNISPANWGVTSSCCTGNWQEKNPNRFSHALWRTRTHTHTEVRTASETVRTSTSPHLFILESWDFISMTSDSYDFLYSLWFLICPIQIPAFHESIIYHKLSNFITKYFFKVKRLSSISPIHHNLTQNKLRSGDRDKTTVRSGSRPRPKRNLAVFQKSLVVDVWLSIQRLETQISFIIALKCWVQWQWVDDDISMIRDGPRNVVRTPRICKCTSRLWPLVSCKSVFLYPFCFSLRHLSDADLANPPHEIMTSDLLPRVQPRSYLNVDLSKSSYSWHVLLF